MGVAGVVARHAQMVIYPGLLNATVAGRVSRARCQAEGVKREAIRCFLHMNVFDPLGIHPNLDS